MMLAALAALVSATHVQTAPQITPPVAPAFETRQCREETLDDPVRLSAADKIYGVSQIWSLAHQHFPFFDQVPDLDWDAEYHHALDEALETQNCYEYMLLLQRFIAKLKDGHSNLMAMPAIARQHTDYVPMQLFAVDGRPIVFAKPEGYWDEVPLGSEVLSVDGRSVDEILADDVYPYVAMSSDHLRHIVAISGGYGYGWGLLIGAPGSTAHLEIKTPQGDIVSTRLVRNANLAAERYSAFEWMDAPLPERAFAYRWIEPGLAYINISTFAAPDEVEQFEAIVHELSDADHVIVDLRSNGGGSTGNGVRVLRHFADRDLQGSAWRTRQTASAHVAWGQAYDNHALSWAEEYHDTYQGNAWTGGNFDPILANPDALDAQLIVLIGPQTASAAEDFLVYADDLPSATILGTPSFGSTGQPLLFEMPGGLQARIVTKRDSYPDGRDFVGPGVQPDIYVAATVEGLLNGRDEVLERAIAFAQTGQ